MQNKTNYIALFPGQGSQKVGMGVAPYGETPLARRLFDTADEVLGFKLSKICFEGPETELTKTEFAQPAILTVSIISYLVALETGAMPPPVAAAGHSLGEYSALVAAEALTFESAVALVHKRGRFMQQAVPVGAGRMIAVLGKEVRELDAAAAQVTTGIVSVANINAPGQVVVAGGKDAVDEFAKIIAPAKIIELQVSAPFHCALMQPAADALKDELEKTVFMAPKFPVFANYSATSVSEPTAIRSSLYSQVCGRVRWVECIQNMIAATDAACFYEFGDSKVLTGLMKRIAPTMALVG